MKPFALSSDDARRLLTAGAVLFSAVALNGCLAAAAGAGYVAGDEINEGDGELDPLEEARGVENGKN